MMSSTKSELDLYNSAISKLGSSAPVIGTGGNFSHLLSKKDVQKLCQAFLDDKLDVGAISYLANLIELSDCFVPYCEDVEDALSELSSPEVGHPITRSSVEKLYRRLAD